MATAKDRPLFQRYAELEIQKDIWQISYIWVDSSRTTTYFKTRTIGFEPKTAGDCPVATFCSYIHGWGDLDDSDMYLKPVALFNDPFRRGRSKLVLCEVYKTLDSPAEVNTRSSCLDAMQKARDERPWFGIEQEYWIVGLDGIPVGCGNERKARNIGLAGLATGTNLVHGRQVAEAHYRACLYAGVKIDGFYSEYVTGMWEFQIGPCEGIDTGDHLWMARFILARVAEDFGFGISYEGKPVVGDYGDATAHTNVSTRKTRGKGGMRYINEAIEKLRLHKDMCAAYIPNGSREGHKNIHERHRGVADLVIFSCGIGDRTATIRIPKAVADSGCGYFEDRRPPANCDPYSVTETIIRILTGTVLNVDGKNKAQPNP